mgnify:CR=1 FL=1
MQVIGHMPDHPRREPYFSPPNFHSGPSTDGRPHTRAPPNSAIKRLRLSACHPASAEHAKHVFMSQALIPAGKMASGGAVCGWMAVLHPFWLKREVFELAPNDQRSWT